MALSASSSSTLPHVERDRVELRGVIPETTWPGAMGAYLPFGGADLHARLPGRALADRGRSSKQAGNDHPTSVPTGVFPTKDGQINIAAAGTGLWKRLCTAIGATELLSILQFATTQLRSQNRKVLNASLADITRDKPSAYWIKTLNEAGIPCGAINTIDQTFAEPQVQHLGIARPVNHPQLGDIRVVGQAIKMSDARSPRLRQTPDLGQHNGRC